MATGNTTLLKLALPVTGELSGTWGDTVNDSITSLLDSAVAGTTTLSADADVTLSDTALASNQARQAIILWTASNGATTRNITAPARSKVYIVVNAGTGSIVVRGAGPTAGVTVVAGERCAVAWNGSDFVKIGGTNGTGEFVTVDTTNLEVTNIKAKDGTASMSIADSTGVASFSANPVLSGGTANGVAYLNGSKVLTTGSALTFDGNAKLTVNGGSSLNGELQLIRSSGFPGNFTLTAGGVDSVSNITLYDTTSGYVAAYRHVSGASGYHNWFQNGSEQMRLTSTGLGIGTTSATGQASNNRVIQIYGAGTANRAQIHFCNSDTGETATDGSFIGVDTNRHFYIINREAADTIFENNGSERARIDANGYLKGTWADKITAVGNTGTAQTLDLRNGNVFTATLTGNCTFTLSNAIAGSSFTLVLTNDATASRTVAWAGYTFRFPGGAASLGRTTTANATDVWFFFTPDGSTFYGSIPMKNLAA